MERDTDISTNKLAVSNWTRLHLRTDPGRLAFASSAGEISWAVFESIVQGWMRRLQTLGARPGDIVAAVAPNSVGLLAVVDACERLGATFAPLNTRWAPNAVREALDRLKPRVLLKGEALVSEAFYTGRVAGRSDAVMLLHTSGSRGEPKVVPVTGDMLRANAEQFAAVTPMSSLDVSWAAAPFFHAAGLNVLTTSLWRIGGASYIDPVFDERRGAALFRRGDATCFFGVPQMWARLLDALSGHRGSLRWGVVGGAPCPDVIFDRARELGIDLYHGYGLTECSPMGTMASPEDASRTFVGKPGPQMDARVVDGQIFLRGPNVAQGYWQGGPNPSRFYDGWLATGDAGYFDERGNLHVLGRLDDMIISGGENVYPAEVEHVLAEHPGLVDVAVLGMPSHRWGEQIVAAYEGLAVSSAGLREWSKSRLGFKAPRVFVPVDAIPRLGSGKVDRAALRQKITHQLNPRRASV